jgi:hypothetical protein
MKLYPANALLIGCFTALSQVSTGLAQDEGIPDCSPAGDCLSCLAISGCSWGSNGVCGCDSETLGADESCYGLWAISSLAARPGVNGSDVTYDGSSYTATPESVCGGIEQAQRNMDICKQVKDCSTCQKTPINSTDANLASSCYWYEDRGYCSSLFADGAGEASTYCPGTPQGNCDFAAENGCVSCVSTTSSGSDLCVWVGDYCTDSCFYSEDKYCFSVKQYPDASIDEICELSNAFYADQTLCDFGGDCANCTSQIRSDGTPCLYYAFTGGGGYCTIGSADGEGYSETCPDSTDVTTSPTEASQNGTSSTAPTDLPILDIATPDSGVADLLESSTETSNEATDAPEGSTSDEANADEVATASTSTESSGGLSPALLLPPMVAQFLIVAIICMF